MKNKKMLIGIVILIVIVIGSLIALMTGNLGTEDYKLNIYFFNETQTSIVPENISINHDDEISMAYEVLDKLSKGPVESGHRKLFESDVTVNAITQNGNSLTVDFAGIPSANKIQTVYVVSKSLCQIDGINKVKVTENGQDIKLDDGSTVGFLTNKDINVEDEPDSPNRIALFFKKSGTDKLVKEYRSVNIADGRSVEEYVISELIKGTNTKNTEPVLPADTSLISVETTDGVCYVNFANNFAGDNNNTEKLAVYSVVNSLTQIVGVDGVQILIDGKKQNKIGSVFVGDVLKYNDDIVQKDY